MQLAKIQIMKDILITRPARTPLDALCPPPNAPGENPIRPERTV